MSMAFFLVLGQFIGRLGQSWDKRDGGILSQIVEATARLPCLAGNILR